MVLRVIPEGLAAASAAVEALTARLAAAEAAAAPLLTSVVPPAADPVSLRSAVGFSAIGNEYVAVAAEGAEELWRSGVGLGETGASYAAGDAAAASTYLIQGGL
ncbi:PE family protein [Mycobacterium decipiens]|uniref:PE family protein n=1 Tax=Mycobacterium decipiens TaxID=1430326 RepID=A0A1X2LY68_9MYCO|nr:PE family protein [Mycobacterium decipiens]OSC42167.1 PE family protein [Mycobacterium decipiens]